MSKAISLKNSSEFGNVYQNGKSFANRCLVMYVKKNGTDINRIGISVSKRIGNSVVRHRITRLIRESYRLSGHMFNSGLDIVVVARAGARDRSCGEITDAMMHLGKLHKVLRKDS